MRAYDRGPKNFANRQFLSIAATNLRDGCGAEQAPKLEGVLTSDGGSGPAPAPTPKPRGRSALSCDYVLGDFGESGDPSSGFRFIGGGTIRNTGNIGIRVRVTFSWEQLGTDPITNRRTYRLAVHASKRVKVTIPATQDQIDLHQSAHGDCHAKAKIVGVFGRSTE